MKRPTRVRTSNNALLPPPGEYDAEISIWPWRILLTEAIRFLAASAPSNAVIVDLMCGTGTLLKGLGELRPDLQLEGYDQSKSYLAYARSQLPTARFHYWDAATMQPPSGADIMVCTAGLHHLTHVQQRRFLARIARHLRPQGRLLLGEELIANFSGKESRLNALRDLYAAIFLYLSSKEPTVESMSASIDVFINDILERGEFKISELMLRKLLSASFVVDEWKWTWPNGEGIFGDALILCTPK